MIFASPEKERGPTVDSLIRHLRAQVQGRVLLDEPLRLHTSLRIGGPADVFVSPAGLEDLRTALRITHQHGVPVVILGNGTNVLVSDQGVRGCVIQIGRGLGNIRNDESNICAEAGVPLPKLAREAARLGLSGLEFAAGIPGTVGGAVVMNAGTHEGDISDIIQEIHVVDKMGELAVLLPAQMQFGYRMSTVRAHHEVVVVAASFRLVPRDHGQIRDKMQALAERRRRTQPLGLPTAGSVFRNPPGDYAGRLIDQCGLKGVAIGGALVSPVHGNFIVNNGDARASDVISLIQLIRDRVNQSTGLHLELELELVGIQT